MKRSLLPAALVLSSGLTIVGQAQAAATSTTFDVTATVGMTCNVSTSPVIFNVIDQGVDTFAKGSIAVICNPGMSFTIALDAGMNYNPVNQMRRVMDAMGNYLEYDLVSFFYGQPWGDGNLTHPADPISAVATGATDIFSVDGILPGLQFKPDGFYYDVVNVTVSY